MNIGRREETDGAVMMLVVVPTEECSRPSPGIGLATKTFGIIRAIFHGSLNCASEYGLSLDTWGREWVFVTPRSAMSKATGLDDMELPRSA